MTALRYDDAHQLFIGRDLWGKHSGIRGYFTIP
jgi:hypothetical protein